MAWDSADEVSVDLSLLFRADLALGTSINSTHALKCPFDGLRALIPFARPTVTMLQLGRTHPHGLTFGSRVTASKYPPHAKSINNRLARRYSTREDEQYVQKLSGKLARNTATSPVESIAKNLSSIRRTWLKGEGVFAPPGMYPTLSAPEGLNTSSV